MNPFVSPAFVAARNTLTEASTLPAHVYTSREWYEREVEQIFRKSWLMAGREEEVSNPGDYMRVDFLGEPLIVIRGRDGVIRTLSASCRHRGAELVTGSGNCQALVCPYHGWTYSVSGQLLAAPQMNGVSGFDISECRLPQVRTETWGGFVCINFDPEAPSLLESLGPFAERFESYRLQDLRLVRKSTFDVECNWKIWAENSRETYHLGVVHRPSFERFRPNGYELQPFEARVEPTKFTINSGPAELASSFNASEKPLFPFLEHISEDDRTRVHYAIHYPHFILNLYPDKLVYHQIFPRGPEAITMCYATCFPQSATEQSDFQATAEASYFPAAEMAIEEDRGICEAQQRGLRAKLASPGRFSPQEEATVHAFANYVLDRVLDSHE